MLKMTVEEQPEGRVRVRLTGRLDTNTHAQCEERLRSLLTAATRVLVLDMADLDYLSSMGLRVLMRITKALDAQGGRCLFTRLQPPIRTVIEIGRALPAETIFASVEEADRYLDLMQRRAREAASDSTTSDG